jgi:hypothetical protein
VVGKYSGSTDRTRGLRACNQEWRCRRPLRPARNESGTDGPAERISIAFEGVIDVLGWVTRHYVGPKMSKNAKVRVTNDGLKGFFGRAREHARKLDRNQKLVPEMTIAFENPSDIMLILSPQRIRVLEFAKKPGEWIESRPTCRQPRRPLTGAVRIAPHPV